MKIVFVTDYSLEHIGGATTSLSEQHNALTEAGHEIHLVALGDELPPAANISIPPQAITMVPPAHTLGSITYDMPVFYNNKKNRQYISELFDELKPDIIHTQSEITLAHMMVTEAKRRNIPVVSTVHTFFWTARKYYGQRFLSLAIRNLFKYVLRRRLAKDSRIPGNHMEQALKAITLSLANQTDAVISPSSHQTRAMTSAGLTVPVFTIPNPYRAPAELAEPTLVTNQGPLRLLWIGRCDPEKRLDVFLEGVAQARKQSGVKILVDVVGQGGQLPKLQPKHKHPDTVFHGKVPHESVPGLVDSAHAVTLSSYHFDNQPMVIAEAISRWRPVVYCDERLTEGTSFAGYLIPRPDAAAWGQELAKLAKNPALLVPLSYAAKHHREFFSPQTYVGQVVDVYETIVAAPAAAGSVL